MHRLLGRLGNPQNALPVVHVAGSKGKGSVTAMLAAVLQAAGYRVATYTRRASHHPCWQVSCSCVKQLRRGPVAQLQVAWLANVFGVKVS